MPVVPVFWIDAEDHDWPEVSGCTVLDSEFAPATVRLADLPGAGSLPIARLTLNDAAQTALDQLDTALPDTEFKAELMAALRAAYAPGRSMATAFGVWLEHVLGPHGLVVYDSSDPAVEAAGARRLRQGNQPAGRDGADCREGRRSAGRQGVSRAGHAAPTARSRCSI